jgi:pimeloyl-ACP methyl ester carboxylesterase
MPDASTTRGGAKIKRFRIPATSVPPAVAPEGHRSIFGAAARRLLKVLVYPITDPVVGAIGEHFAARWEELKRPYRLRSFTPENYRVAEAPSLTIEELAAMCSGGRMLLFVHGTFSTSHAAFGDLPADTLRELNQRYGSRVVAFDHPTLADAPDENVRWLLAHLPQSTIQADIVCHSRGGLVARVLAERQGAFGLDTARIDVRRIVFGGVPNSGTALADPDHMVDMIDRFTTALTLLPTGPVTETFEALVTVIKIIGHGALKSLRGLASMHPKGTFLETLNQSTTQHAEYFAIASNYEPTDRGLRALVTGAADDLADEVFGNVGNDLVVPTEGVWGKNGGSAFPLAPDRVLSFGPTQGVMHTSFFRQGKVAEDLLAWLG